MKKNILLFIIFFSLSIVHCSAQPITFEHHYGWLDDDYGRCILQTSDGGYMVAGYTKNGPPLHFYHDIYLVKIDSLGNTEFIRSYGGDGDDRGYSIIENYEGGYIIGGNTYYSSIYKIYLINIEINGDTLWTKTIGGIDGRFYKTIRKTDDNGYIILNRIGSFYGISYINGNGNIIWDKTYQYLTINSLDTTHDGGYIFTGYIGNYPDYDICLVKTNSNGDSLWTKTYGGADKDCGYSVKQTSDEGFIIAGYTESYGAGFKDVYLIKTNSNGDTLWTKTYGGAGFDYGYSVQQTLDSGYIITGYTSSFGSGGRDVYLIKTDENGDTLWTRTFGGPDDEEAYCVQQTTDGGYVIVGHKYISALSGYDVYVIKTDSLGNVYDNSGIDNDLQFTNYELRIYPNPVNSTQSAVCSWQFPEAEQEGEINIYNIYGKKVYEIRVYRNKGNEEIWLSDIQPGIYIITISHNNRIFGRKKVIVY